MKKIIVFCIALLMIGIGTTQTINTTEAVFSKDEVVRERFALKREQLAEVVAKKVEHVENSIKKKLKEQEDSKIKKQKEDAEKKDAAKKVAEEQAANQVTAQEAAQAAANQAAIQEEQQAPQTPVNEETVDAVSGASTNGQERGQRNREWGNQLSDPNLTPAERQGIIQEKKNYNRNNH